MSRYTIVLICLLSLCGCDGGTDPRQPEFSVSPDRQWAGGELVVSATGSVLGEQAVVLANDTELEILEATATEIRARLTATANGPQSIQIRQPGGEFAVGDVDVYGFMETRWYPLPLTWLVYEWPVPVGTAIIGGYRGDPPGVAVISLTVGAISRFDSIHDPDFLHGPGLGGEPDEVYLSTESSEVSAWRLTRPPELLWEGRPISHPWVHWQLSPDTWLQGSDDNVRTQVGVPPDGPFTDVELLASEFGGVTQVVTLPDLNRATVAASSSRFGLPLFELSTGRVTARVDIGGAPSVAALRAAGSFLVAGWDPTGSDLFPLVEVDPVSGMILRSVPLSGWGEAMLVDEARGLAFLLVVPGRIPDQPRDPSHIEVRSLDTFELLGRIEVPQLTYWFARLVADDERLYLVLSESAPDATAIPVFRLLPL